MTDGNQLITKGFANVPLDAPGLGIELNEEEVKKHLNPKTKAILNQHLNGMKNVSHDRIWS